MHNRFDVLEDVFLCACLAMNVVKGEVVAALGAAEADSVVGQRLEAAGPTFPDRVRPEPCNHPANWTRLEPDHAWQAEAGAVVDMSGVGRRHLVLLLLQAAASLVADAAITLQGDYAL